MLNQNKFYFTQPENAVMFDKELTSTAKVVYCSLLNHMNKKTRQCRLCVKTIAEEVSRSVRTVQRSLSQDVAESRFHRVGNSSLVLSVERKRG